MKIAIISDLHLGDPKSIMGNAQTIDWGYKKFKEAVKSRFLEPMDYLILLGDIMDFAVSRYQEAYQAGMVFFNQLVKDSIAREIIYVPGNHDYDLWHVIEYEVNVINKINRNQPVELFRYSVPGILDDRAKPSFPSLALRKVTANKDPNKPKYAGLFLDKITVENTGKETHFNYAYPNVYLVNEEESILITHGQYFETFWALSGELALRVFSNDLKIHDPSQLDLAELVGINSPLSQLSSSGSGQAGPLTERIQAIEHMVYDHKTDRLGTYIDRTIGILKIGLGLIGKIALIFFNLKKFILNKTTSSEEIQFNDEFIQKEEVRKRVLNFYNASLCEIIAMKNDESSIDIPIPNKIIFGHTHIPTSWGSLEKPNDRPLMGPNNKPIYLYNCGGWLTEAKNGQNIFHGAEIFFYETGKGMISVSIK